MDFKRFFMVLQNVDNPIFDFGTFRNPYWQFNRLLAIKKCDILCTYLLSAQVFLEGGVSFFMDSNRFFMVLLTVLIGYSNYLVFFPAKPVVHSPFEIIVLVAMWLIFRLWNSQIRLSVQKSCEQLLFQCERSSQVVQRGAAAISEQQL